MQDKDYFFLVIAMILSLGISYLLYFFKDSKKTKIKIVLSIIRSITLFLLFLLVINPRIKKIEIEIIKPKLVLLADNSKSIVKLNQEETVSTIFNQLNNNLELQDKFDIDKYTFAEKISYKDSLDFNKNTTNIYNSLKELNKLYRKSSFPIIIITDGNQTVGNNLSTFKSRLPIYPIIIGDTAVYKDLYISMLNVNKYAYLNHKFPVEIFINFSGSIAASSIVKVREGKTTIFTKKIQFNKDNNTAKINFFIDANKVGRHIYNVTVSPLLNEKNTLNNNKTFSIEVLNEQSKILIVSEIVHPDIAMFKRSIEHNKQRKVVIKRPIEIVDIDEYQLVMIYQPNNNFNKVVGLLNKKQKNIFYITGTKTDWSFLNNAQSYFSKKVIQTTENFSPIYNSTYQTFLTKDIGFSNFQPISDIFGKISFNVPHTELLYQQIGNIESKDPLLSTITNNNKRIGVLFGENSWRWRMTSKVETQSFEEFDTFINKIIQYLVSNKKSNYLEVSSKKVYYQNEKVKIVAKAYDANYQFNSKTKLWIKLTNKSTNKQIEYPFALTNNTYEVNMSDLNKGNYSFKVFDPEKQHVSYGEFTILDYNIEEQFVNSNLIALKNLAANSKGTIIYPNNIKQFVSNIISNDKYKSIQKSREITSSLINWRWLLGIIILLLTIEWFIRKYKGFI